MGNIHTVGPDEALIVSGNLFSPNKKTLRIGGWIFAWKYLTNVQKISLRVMTLNPRCKSVETAQGVPLTVTGVAQIKVMKNVDLLKAASEQFLGKREKDIKDSIIQTLEGHLRAILGTLSVEEVYKDRDQFAALVREVASPDLARMGIDILSFTIKDVFDDVSYLGSLGMARTAAVHRDAEVRVVQTGRDAGIREAECKKAASDVHYSTETNIQNNVKEFKLQSASFEKEVNIARAKAQLAYQLQEAKTQQRIRQEEIQIKVVEKTKQIEIEEKEILKKEKDLMASIKLPSEAEAYRIETIAAGVRTQTLENAMAEAEKVKLIGSAEARSIETVGKAEAELMRLKAEAYRQYGDAAIMALVLEALPKIAAEVASPLSRMDEVVILGGKDRITQAVSRLVSQIPPSVLALTGFNLTDVIENYMKTGNPDFEKTA